MDHDPSAAWPPYAFVPGGPWPHPHSLLLPGVAVDARAGLTERAVFMYGLDLFNAGYYWESHEVWEGLWHVHGRRGPEADVLKALIKLAAAGVKVRQRQPRGVVTHASRAADLFAAVVREHGARRFGLDLEDLAAIARAIARDPPPDPGTRDDRVVRVFAFRVEADDR